MTTNRIKTDWPPRGTHIILILVLLAPIGFALYVNTLKVPFTFDDKPNITENPYIRMTTITPEQITQLKNSRSLRPFSNFTFALNYYFHQYHLMGYHLINILIHIINAFLTVTIANLTLRLCRRQHALLTAVLAGFLWIVHPLHTQSVTYIVQRMTSLATLFYLLSLLCYIRARMMSTTHYGLVSKRNGLFLCAATAGILGLASKQIVVTLPILLFLYEWFFFQDLNAAWGKRQIKWILTAIMLLGVIAFIYLGDNPVDRILSGYAKRDFTPVERLMTQPSIVIYYISLLFFPHPSRLNLDYDFSLSQSLFTPPSTALAIIAIIILLSGAAMAARKHRLVSFAVIWFFANLALESSFLGLELIFEHRTYLPSVFPIIAIAALLVKKFYLKKLAWALLLSVICLQGVWTIQRNGIWRDEITLWKDCLDKSPQKARTYNGLGVAYIDVGKPKNAFPYLKTAIQLNPDFQRAYVSLGTAFLKTDRPYQAIDYYKKALGLGKATKKACVNMGMALQKTGQLDDAIRYYFYALEPGPYSIAYNNLGNAYFEKGELATSRHFFEKAIELAPTYGIAQDNLNKLQKIITTNKKNLQQIKQQLRSQPLNAGLLYQLATLEIAAGDYGKAAETYETLSSIIPDSSTVFYNLACLYARQNNPDKAVANLKQAIAKGYNNWSRLKTDSDLENIRETRYFQKLITEIAMPKDNS